jgi:hypothetical protein
MSRLTRRLVAFLETQLMLWDRYGQRYELSGAETAARQRGPMQWVGGQLRGDVLPTAVTGDHDSDGTSSAGPAS